MPISKLVVIEILRHPDDLVFLVGENNSTGKFGYAVARSPKSGGRVIKQTVAFAASLEKVVRAVEMLLQEVLVDHKADTCHAGHSLPLNEALIASVVSDLLKKGIASTYPMLPAARPLGVKPVSFSSLVA